ELLNQLSGEQEIEVDLQIGSLSNNETKKAATGVGQAPSQAIAEKVINASIKAPQHRNNLNKMFTFDNFVEGKSNQLARAASSQVAENPGKAYNPLFIYGGVGLGKTHLMHAIGNLIIKNNAKVVYLHSERFVADMVRALQTNSMNAFKQYYR